MNSSKSNPEEVVLDTFGVSGQTIRTGAADLAGALEVIGLRQTRQMLMVIESCFHFRFRRLRLELKSSLVSSGSRKIGLHQHHLACDAREFKNNWYLTVQKSLRINSWGLSPERYAPHAQIEKCTLKPKPSSPKP